jgi:hypothetical protein
VRAGGAESVLKRIQFSTRWALPARFAGMLLKQMENLGLADSLAARIVADC